jgi:DhnA family fructose-bisphosphate aldolase class Ia
MLTTNSQIGKTKRFNKLFSNRSGKIIITPFDDSLITGPAGGLEDLKFKIGQIVLNPPDAIIGFKGLFRNHCELINNVPGILNITASTTKSNHTKKVVVGTVNTAVALGLEGVAVHVNISSKYESDMLKILSDTAHECDKLGLPLIAIMYLRTEYGESDNNYDDLKMTDANKYAELVAHAARVGVELGADIIKAQYTGSAESFNKVISACAPVPVVAAGGPLMDSEAMITMAYDVICAGGAGICYGRNIFGRKEPFKEIAALKAIVHEGLTPDKAIGIFNEI